MLHSLHVHKFGGTSVGSAERMAAVPGLVDGDHPAVVVVSALGGVTDVLLRAIDAAMARSGGHADLVAGLRERHRQAIELIAVPDERRSLGDRLDTVWRELGELLDGIYLLRECTPRTRDAVIGMGERASAPILAAAFRRAGRSALDLDARELIRTDDSFGEGVVDFDETARLTKMALSAVGPDSVAVVTGFIAATAEGVQTTLGRSGSDYTATILAGALGAHEVVIWTDVDGVMSADPRVVPSAFPLEELTYREAGELAYFGAKVLHPRTIQPLRAAGIPLRIRNTMNPDAPGTLIRERSTDTGRRVKAVSTVRGLAIVMVEGAGMIGVRGIAARTFTALASADVNVLVISQASSEQSICIGVTAPDAERARAVLEAAFELEIMRGMVSGISVIPDCAVVSLVGDRMRMRPGLAGRMFSTLGYANINVLAIAQGAAETNISAVVSEADAVRAVRALHDAFARSHARAHVVLIGAGVVGARFLELLGATRSRLRDSRHLELRLVGLARSTRMIWDENGLPDGAGPALLGEDADPFDLDRLVDLTCSSHLERTILVDATASETVARRYGEFLDRGIAVVTPNKRANTVEQAYYDRLQMTAARRGVPFLYETTVGAALPIVAVLADLVRSGDRVRRIEGVLSGTLAFVFNRLAQGNAFSAAVREARKLGFTEPDPRDDLGGEDVARKILTLAREAGWPCEREDIEVESLVPSDLQGGSVDEFLDGLAEHDAAWRERSLSGRLQYVAEAEPGRLRVGVRALDADAAFARLAATDNMVVFTTDRYVEQPLIVQGAGAGPEVTAGGMIADVVRAAESMT